MKTMKIEILGGTSARDAIERAVKEADGQHRVAFDFNSHHFIVDPHESISDACVRFERQTEIKPITNEEAAENARKWIEQTAAKESKAIADAGVMTESQLRESATPRPRTIENLSAYINSLVDRPHDYGTCVYAMSLSAVAAFQYVAHKLGVSGFQASCADMDILRHTRDFKWGKVLNYENLLYPQYCDDEHFPSAKALIEKNAEELAKRAKKFLDEKSGPINEGVVAHWKYLASLAK